MRKTTEESVLFQRDSKAAEEITTAGENYGATQSSPVVLPVENEIRPVSESEFNLLSKIKIKIIPELLQKFPTITSGKRYLKSTLHLCVNSIVFGGSVKSWLDPIMKALMYDINEVLSDLNISLSSDKDTSFDTRSISIIGAYIALGAGISGYFMYRYMMKHPDILDKHTHRLSRIAQTISALGLSGYLYTLDNYIITATCSSNYPKHVAICPAQPANDPRLSLKIFCCIAPEYTTETSLGVATNDYTLVAFNPAAAKLSAAAMDRLRYDYRKKTKIYVLSDLISTAASISAYFTVRYGIIPEQALYYSIVPLTTFYLANWSLPTLLSALPLKYDKPIIRINNTNRAWQYISTFLKALATGTGRAALYHAIALTYEFQFLPYAQERIISRYLTTATLAAYAGFKAYQSADIKEFGKKFLTIVVPEEKFVNEHKHALATTHNINLKKMLGVFAIAGVTGLSTYFFIQQAIEKQIPLPENNDPATQYLATVASPGGMALRFSAAGFGLITYGAKTFWRDTLNGFRPIKKSDLNNNLKVKWPTLAAVATAILMMIGIYKAISDAVNSPDNDTANLYHKIIMTTLSVVLIGLCLFGDLIFKRLNRLYQGGNRYNFHQPARNPIPVNSDNRPLLSDLADNDDPRPSTNNIKTKCCVLQ